MTISDEMHDMVLRLHAEGHTRMDIARRVRVSERSVRAIVSGERAKRKPSKTSDKSPPAVADPEAAARDAIRLGMPRIALADCAPDLDLSPEDLERYQAVRRRRAEQRQMIIATP
jgi:hypothetical protein